MRVSTRENLDAIPGFSEALPYGVEFRNEETSYQIVTANYHHLFPDALVKEYKLGFMATYLAWKQSLESGFPPLSEELIRKFGVLQAARVLAVRPMQESFSVTPLDRARRSPTPDATAWGTVSILAYLESGIARAPSHFLDAFRNSIVPPYCEWYADPEHNHQSWQALCNPRHYESQSSGDARVLTNLALYLQRLSTAGMTVTPRSRLLRFCQSPRHLDNPRGREIWCACDFPCTREPCIAGLDAAAGPQIFVPAAREKAWIRTTRRVGLTVEEDRILAPDSGPLLSITRCEKGMILRLAENPG